jgi:hypothetical protein
LPISEAFSASQRRKLAAIMFSDVVGYTAIMGRDEGKGVRAIACHRERLRALLPQFNGRLVGEIGDGALSSFDSVINAVECARELQSVLQEDPELRLRIGIHLGDVLFTDNTVLGDGVNVASRRFVSTLWPAIIYYIGLGDRQCSLEGLAKAYEAHDPSLMNIKMDRVFDPLRSDPRFIQLLRKVGLDNTSSPAATAASRPGL